MPELPIRAEQRRGERLPRQLCSSGHYLNCKDLLRMSTFFVSYLSVQGYPSELLLATLPELGNRLRGFERRTVEQRISQNATAAD
jgi:hypothetical protein